MVGDYIDIVTRIVIIFYILPFRYLTMNLQAGLKLTMGQLRTMLTIILLCIIVIGESKCIRCVDKNVPVITSKATHEELSSDKSGMRSEQRLPVQTKPINSKVPGVDKHFEVWPENEAGYGFFVPMDDERVEFPCQPHGDSEVVTWSRKLQDSTRQDTVAVDGTVVQDFQHKYEALNHTGIIVKNIFYDQQSLATSDGQQLWCSLMGATVSAHAYMIVIDDYVTTSRSPFVFGQWNFLRCTQEYHGLWPPVMKFYDYPSGRPLVTRNVTTVPQEVSYATDYIVEENQMIYWDIYFEAPPAGLIPNDDPQNFYNRDPPTFYNTLQTNTVVNRGPHKMIMYPKSRQYKVNDIVMCQAQGVPEPNLHWEYNNNVVPGSQIVITQGMVGMTGRLSCVASNNFSSTQPPGNATEWVDTTVIGEQSAYHTYAKKWPVNMAVVRGSSVVFECVPLSTGEVVFWARQLHDSTTETNVVYDGQVISGYENEYGVINGTNILVISTDAQRLKCGLLLSTMSMHAYLLTLGSEPLCGHNISDVENIPVGQYVNMYCQVSYVGLWAPVMTWGTMETEGDRWNINDLAVDESSGNTVRVSLYLKLESVYNEKVFQCKTHFLPPPNGIIPNDDDNNVYSQHAPVWTSVYKTKRFFLR